MSEFPYTIERRVNGMGHATPFKIQPRSVWLNSDGTTSLGPETADFATPEEIKAWEAFQSLRAQLEGVPAQRDSLLAERSAWQLEKEKMLAEREASSNEHAELIAGRDLLFSERDRLIAERDALIAERDAILAEREEPAKPVASKSKAK